MIRRVAITGLFAAALGLVGCGSGLKPVSGTVNYDGKALSGATVTFISTDGEKSATGVTDASGAFTLSMGGKPGIPAGSYKVLVAKTSAPESTGEAVKPGTPEYMAAMQKEMRPGGKPKSLIPTVYGEITGTPLTATVPSASPIVLDLKATP